MLKQPPQLDYEIHGGQQQCSKLARRDPWDRAAIVLAILAGTVIVFVVMMPTLDGGNSRQLAHRIQSASNLRQIYLAASMYADAYGHQLPPTFAVLAATQDLTSDVFIAANGTEERAPTDANGHWADGIIPGGPHCSYHYAVRPGWTDAMLTPRMVLAYEPLKVNDGEGANILYGDGRVDWLDAKAATSLIAQVEAGVNPPK